MDNSIQSLNLRYRLDRYSNWGNFQNQQYQTTPQSKIKIRGKDKENYASSLIRLREDKLRSVKSAIFNSYQSAVIQFDQDDRQYHFRCLINHDKLKVDYQDKILSIPFRAVPVELQHVQAPLSEKMVDTGTPSRFLDDLGILRDCGEDMYQYRVRPGDTFKWVSGNQRYMPDSYWIITTQYSEETAYFRGEIRKAEDQVQIIPILQDGSEGDPIIYHGWTTGPDEDQAVWNVKKGVVWNDMFWTKILYITKDPTTSAFFHRFDRVIINGESFEVQTFNDNYGSSKKNMQGGLIRVALKETYTSTNEQIKEQKEEETQEKLSNIYGLTTIYSYDTVIYRVDQSNDQPWTISEKAPLKIIKVSSTELKLEVLPVTQIKQCQIKKGNMSLDITIKPFLSNTRR